MFSFMQKRGEACLLGSGGKWARGRGTLPAAAWGGCVRVALSFLWLEASRRCLRGRGGHTTCGLGEARLWESKGHVLAGGGGSAFPLLLRERLRRGPGSQDPHTGWGWPLFREWGWIHRWASGQVGAGATGQKLPTQASSSRGLECPLVPQPLPCSSGGHGSLICKMGHEQSLLFAMPQMY